MSHPKIIMRARKREVPLKEETSLTLNLWLNMETRRNQHRILMLLKFLF